MVKIQKHDTSFIDETVKFIGNGTLTLAKNAEIRAYTVIEMGGGKLSIGEKSVIGYNSMFQCTGSINIGKGSLLGPHCVFIASAHGINDKPLISQPLIRGMIDIGNNVWFGANCTINYNIKIGNNSVIGANSFVNKDIPADQIWAGSPAKLIKNR